MASWFKDHTRVAYNSGSLENHFDVWYRTVPDDVGTVLSGHGLLVLATVAVHFCHLTMRIRYIKHTIFLWSAAKL